MTLSSLEWSTSHNEVTGEFPPNSHTHSILFVPLTGDRHCCLFFAFFLSSPQLNPLASISFSTVRRQVSFGCPLALYPDGVQCIATLAIADGFADGYFLRTYPIQRLLLFFTSELILFVEVARRSSAFEMMLGQKMFRMRCRHRQRILFQVVCI